MEKSFFKRPAIRFFLIRFFAIFILVEIFLILFPPIHYQLWLAQTIGNVLHIPVNGIFLSVNEIRFEISAFCTGLTTWGLLLGLLYGFSFPRGWGKMKYALLGLAFILVVNFFRLLAIVYIGKVSSFIAVDTLHILTWFGMSALVLAIWYRLLSRHLKTHNMEKIASFLLDEKR